MNITLNGTVSGVISTPSPGVYTWTSPANTCGTSSSLTYNSNNRTLSYSGTAGSTTLTGTATLYGNTYP